MRFSYKSLRLRKPAIALNGRLSRPRPLILASITGPRDTFVDWALLDTGADDSVFPDRAAIKMGVDLSSAPIGEASGVGSGAVTVRYAPVLLRLTDGREFREWTAWVGFTNAPMRQSLLGFAGCLQFFHAHFLGDLETVELTVNSLYSGS